MMDIKQVSLKTERPDILRARLRYGLWYGVSVGLAFAIFTWGIDGYILSTLHGLHPWIKFLTGSILCMGVGGVTGWLTMRVNKSVYALVFWLVTAYLFTRLSINVPLQYTPQIMSTMEPATQGLLHYVYYEDFSARVTVAFTWIGIFVGIAGLLQIPMSDFAVFSNSPAGKIGPIAVCAVLMSICGMIVDNGLINAPLREAIIAANNTIQFVVDNNGKDVAPEEARKMHTGAFRTTQDSVTNERSMVVSGYDKTLGQISILIRFESSWVECLVLYNQPVSCEFIKQVK